MTISIIIPTFNESALIEKLVTYLLKNGGSSLIEVIVSDGGSTDDTLLQASRANAKTVHSDQKGRAAQMNYGASLAKGDILYFIHADCYPPITFVNDILTATRDGYNIGRYRTLFNSDNLLLKINAWLTRFDLFVCMGGDQTLFITRSLFEQCKGFNEKMNIMEEYEFCARARQTGKYKILKKAALISARKYNNKSWWKVQRANLKVINMYNKGASQMDMVNMYAHMLK